MVDTNHLVSRNLSEELVDMFLDDCLKETGTCSCERCRADVRALALNHMPPRYVVTNLGDAFVRVEAMSTQAQADIIIAIMSAIKAVRENPRHDEEHQPSA